MSTTDSNPFLHFTIQTSLGRNYRSQVGLPRSLNSMILESAEHPIRKSIRDGSLVYILPTLHPLEVPASLRALILSMETSNLPNTPNSISSTSPTPNHPPQTPAVNSSAWIDSLLRDKCALDTLRDFQLQHAKDIIDGHDLVLVIATGQGKTLVLHSGLIAAQARQEEGIGVLVCPTKALVDQHVQSAKKRGIRALAITSDTVRMAELESPGRNLFSELASGSDVRLAVMTPQMLMGSRMSGYLHNPKFKAKLKWMLVDEADLVYDKSSIFCAPYRALSPLRSMLGSHVIWVAVTGSATTQATAHIVKAFGFKRGHYVNARYSLDRPNIRYVTRFFEHATTGRYFWDLSFLVPFKMTNITTIPITIVFVQEISVGYALMQFLDELISYDIPNRLEVVRLFNSMHSPEYRDLLFNTLSKGANSSTRIVIVTDTFTYGVDISVPRVVIMGLCPSTENRKQKMGRPGRDGSFAEVITYAPVWVREVDPSMTLASAQMRTDAERRKKLPSTDLRWYNATPEQCPRAVDFAHFDEAEAHNPLTCLCSIHHPSTTDTLHQWTVEQWIAHAQDNEVHTQPKPQLRSDSTFRTLTTAMQDSLTRLLEQWRMNHWREVRGTGLGLPSNLFLPRSILLRVVAKAHICSTFARFQEIVEGWEYLETHGKVLYAFLHQILLEFKEIYSELEKEADKVIKEEDNIVLPNTSAPRPVRLVLGPKTNEPFLGERPPQPHKKTQVGAKKKDTQRPSTPPLGTKKRQSVPGVSPKKKRPKKAQENILEE